jgi:hypothetical protein
MDDKQIQNLVRMAMEAEDLERAGEGLAPLARIGPGPAPLAWRLLKDVGIGVAAAACLTLGFLYFRPAPNIPVVKKGVAMGGGGTRDAVTPAAKDKCVVMAMFRDTDGRCSCVQMRETEWRDQRRLAEVPRAEIRNVALQSPCSSDAEQVLILAMEGQSETLPRNQHEAEVLAQGLSTAAASVGRHADVASLAYTLMPALMPGATVVADSLTMRQPSRVRELLPDTPIPWK